MSNEIILDELKWSFSKLNLYDTCHHAFLLNYVKEVEKSECFFAQFGTCGHKVLEKYCKGELQIFDLVNEYKKLYPQIVTQKAPPNRYKNLNQSYYAQGFEYFESFNGYEEEILGVEKEVDFKVGKYNFGGFIDLVLRDKNENCIILEDHKSKSKMDKKEKEKYLKQLYLYSIPIFEEYGEYPKYLRFNLFKVQDYIVQEFDINQLEQTKQWAIESIEKIYQEEKWLPLSSRFFCSYICGSRGNCEYIPN